MNKLVLILVLLPVSFISAQECKTTEELDAVPGKHIDVAHFEWPAQKATWLNEMKTPARKAMANKVLLAIENIEKDSRKDFTLTGGVIKSSFSASTWCLYNRKNIGAVYAYQLGCYKYLCIKNKQLLNGEYNTVLRANVNPYFTSQFSPSVFFDSRYNAMIYDDGKCEDGLDLFEYVGFREESLVKIINGGEGYHQDITPEEEAKLPVGHGTYITRTWYITKPGKSPLLAVSRKEFLESLLAYYEKERQVVPLYKAEIDKEYARLKARGYDERWYNNKLGVYKDYEKAYAAKKEAVNKLLREQSDEWLAMPAIIDVNKSWFSDAGNPGYAGAFYLKSFSEKETDAPARRIYRYNPAYFIDEASAKPQLIRITFRYVKVPYDKRLVENFTKNFDRAAWQKLVQ